MGFDIGGVATLTSPSGTTLSVDAASNWMKVDASGILTRTQTPYMRGQLTGKGGNYNAGGGPLLVTADENVGNCWNDSTGYFTCPVAGYYMAAMGNIANIQAGYIKMRKNGAEIHFTHWNFNSGAWHYVSLSCVVSCAASDTLHWTIEGLTPGTNGFYAAGQHCMYSIALMA